MGSYEADRKAELKKHKNRLLEYDYINNLLCAPGILPGAFLRPSQVFDLIFARKTDMFVTLLFRNR